MATIPQGILAGNLANGLNLLALFRQQVAAAVAANGQVTQITFMVTGNLSPIQFNPPAPLTVADSANLLNEIVTLSDALASEWTAQLNAL
jgi:hypothetical protein